MLDHSGDPYRVGVPIALGPLSRCEPDALGSCSIGSLIDGISPDQ